MKYTKRIIFFAIMLIAVGISNVCAAKGSVTTDGVRVRKSPSTDAEIVTVLNKTAPVEIIEEVDGWYKIKYDGIGTYEGYINKNLIHKQDEVASQTPTPTATPTPQPTETPTTPTPVVSPTPEETPSPETTPSPEVLPSPEIEEPKENLLGEKTVNNETKVYILPVVTSSMKDTITKKTKVAVQEIAGNFAYIEYDNKSGWIRINSLQTFTQSNSVNNTDEQPVATTSTSSTDTTTSASTEKKGYVNVNEAIVRKDATTSSEMVTSLKLNNEVTIIGEKDDFYKIKLNGAECYIAKFLISDTKQSTTSRSSAPRQETVVQTPVEEPKVVETENATIQTPVVEEPKVVPESSVGQKMADMAKSFIGYKYVYGGASPTTGFDCSGFVYYICGQFGYKVNRTADNQIYNGVLVEKSNLQPGDLVFFSNYRTYTGIGHVGIYIGNNQFVHASTATTGVIMSSLNESNYVKRYVTARRMGV